MRCVGGTLTLPCRYSGSDREEESRWNVLVDGSGVILCEAGVWGVYATGERDPNDAAGTTDGAEWVAQGGDRYLISDLRAAGLAVPDADDDERTDRARIVGLAVEKALDASGPESWHRSATWVHVTDGVDTWVTTVEDYDDAIAEIAEDDDLVRSLLFGTYAVSTDDAGGIYQRLCDATEPVYSIEGHIDDLTDEQRASLDAEIGMGTWSAEQQR